MQREEYRAALAGAQPAVDAAWAKVERAGAAWLEAKTSGDPARYEATWAAWCEAADAYEAAARRFHALLVSLIPVVEWRETV
jgi:hypothetical protein